MLLEFSCNQSVTSVLLTWWPSVCCCDAVMCPSRCGTDTTEQTVDGEVQEAAALHGVTGAAQSPASV